MIYSSAVCSQISEGGIPPSFHYQQLLRSSTSPIKVPINFNVDDLRETDEWRARDGGPLPVGKLIPVDYTMDNSGYHTLLPGGENIWRLHLNAKDAVAIMLYYKDFYIPEGGRLFIYNPGHSQLLGAYTHQTHPSGGLFATEFIGCDELILEYVASDISDEKPRIAIGEIGYGYNLSALRAFCGISAPGRSGDCNVNINCEEGNAWQNEKKSVCYMVQKIGNLCYICTGSLMNNTAEDFKPLILTALHCGYEGTYTTFASEEDLQQWMFYFNRERDECSNTSLAKVSQSMTGCTLLVKTGLNGGTEGLLLLLNDTIPENYDVYYNGWDRSGDIASSGVCIHHPQGDYKKISTFGDPIRTTTFEATGFFTCMSNAHWTVTFKATANGSGITEGGSSGSPLYNENKLVIGTLSGGPDYKPPCAYPRGINLYGKLSYHWDKYKADSSQRMDVWLDPLHKGLKTLSGRFRTLLKPSPLNLKAVNLGQSVSLTWEAPSGQKKPNSYNVYRNNTKIDETTQTYALDNDPIMGTIVYSVSAVYDDDEESSFASTSLFLIKYKAPFDLKAERQQNSNQIMLSWNMPVYEQTIYWGTMSPKYMAGFGQDIPFYYGQIWSAKEIEPLHKKTVKSVQFIPINKNSYEIFISQGERSYKQPIENSSLKMSVLNTILLNTPFVIDGTKSLIISIYISDAGTEFPAITDDGPVISGKGNICSFDGMEWFRFDEGEDPDEFNFNFIVSAILSSESGELPDVSLSTLHAGMKEHSLLMFSRKAVLSLDDTPVTLRNSTPALFPEITKYIIYRYGSYHKTVIPPETSYTDVSAVDNIYYEVSALYDQVESDKSDKAYITVVGNEFMNVYPIYLSPTLFSNELSLHGYEYVSRVEVVSVSSRVSLIINNPSHTIDTSTLAPGLYFFRLYDLHNQQKVIKAIKRRL